MKLFTTATCALVALTRFAQSANTDSCCSVNAGYDPNAAVQQATRLSTHSWEYGTLAEAMLELYNPELSVSRSRKLRLA